MRLFLCWTKWYMFVLCLVKYVVKQEQLCPIIRIIIYTFCSQLTACMSVGVNYYRKTIFYIFHKKNTLSPFLWLKYNAHFSWNLFFTFSLEQIHFNLEIFLSTILGAYVIYCYWKAIFMNGVITWVYFDGILYYLK